MKKILLLIILSLVFRLPALSLAVGVDLMSLDSLYYRNLSVKGAASLSVNSTLRLLMAAAWYDTLDIDNQVKAFDLSFSALYTIPRCHGLYIGVTLLNPVFLTGYDSPSDRPLFLTSLSLGYELRVPYFSLDVSVAVLDAMKASESAYQVLRAALRQYSEYRISVLASVRIDFKKKE